MAMIKCPECGRDISDKADVCVGCGFPIRKNINTQQNQVAQNNAEFHGIYKFSLFGDKKPVYCPRCKSANCSWYNEQKVIPGKTKTKYTANLNPLHPFTLVNKKEKVVKKEQTYTQKKIMCNNCGYTFL